MDGFINFIKPPGMTSHDVVKVLRRVMGEKKAGHTGTLDPMAVGVLPVGFGSATKITEYLEQDFKTYRCEMVLGKVTDTGDMWGTVLDEKTAEAPPLKEVQSFANSFLGEIDQVPPMYSAVRVNGKRLYEYARNGEAVEVKARKVTIREMKILNVEDNRILFDVECSKGTYVRTLCTEMGELLGCGGAMSFLARTGSGAFRIQNGITLEEIEEHLEKGGSPEDLLLPVDYPIGDYGSVMLNEKNAHRFVNGGHINFSNFSLKKGNLGQYYKVYRNDTNTFLGMAVLEEKRKKLIPHKVFHREG